MGYSSLHDLYSCDRESDEYICVNSCGTQVHDHDNAEILRPNGRHDYHLLFITGGYCTVEIDGVTTTLVRGDMLFYRPGEPQLYTFGQNTRCTSFWLHLAGTGIPELVEKAHLTNGNIFHLGDLSLIQKTSMKLIVEIQSKQRGYEQYIRSYVELIFAAVYRLLPVNEQSHEVITDERIARVLNIMSRLYYVPFNVQAYSNMCGVGRDRFMHLFREEVGVPPQHYLIGLRLQHAKRLLTTTDMPVGEIAERIGFVDPLYFSRIFRRQIGVSPTDYRKIFEP